MATYPSFVSSPNVGVVQILNADASNQKTVFTAGASGSKVSALMATSTDTSSRILQVSITRSATNYIIGSVTVPIAAGTDGVTAAVDLLGSTLLPGVPTDNDGTHYILLKSGDTINISSTTTVTTAKTVSITAIGADF
jgi:hypothetical protein